MLQQESAHKLVKLSRHLSCSDHKGVWLQTFCRRLQIYWLSARCVGSQYLLYMPKNAVQTLKTSCNHWCFSDADILDLCEWMVGCSEMNVRTLMLFGHWHFGSLLANGRMLRGESRYSRNNSCGLHCCAGRGVVISSVQKITRPTIPSIRWLTTYTSVHKLKFFWACWPHVP